MSAIEDTAMTADAIQPGDFETRVTEIVNRILARHKPRPVRPDPDREISLAERFVRVEEALKHQNETMQQGFAQAEKRFEQIDKRFEQIDKRFEQVDKRFMDMLAHTDKRFTEMREDMNTRFAQVDKRLDHQLDVLKWSVGLLVTLFIGLTTFLKLAV